MLTPPISKTDRLNANGFLKPVLARIPHLLSDVVNEHWVDFALSHVSKRLRLARTVATIESIVNETADIKRFRLRPNRNFSGFEPGQFVPVRIVIDSIVHERYYSLTSAVGDEVLEIAVKRDPRGKVSTWMHAQLRVGDVIELGAAGGAFTLPLELPEKLLFVAGGSGVTPVFNLIRHALDTAPDCDIAMLYYARSPADFAFSAELQELAATHSRVKLHFLSETPDSPHGGRFGGKQLARLVPDFAQRDTYLCGPAGLMDAVAAHWAKKGCAEKLKREVFGMPVSGMARPGLPSEAPSDVTAFPVTFRRSQQMVENNRPSLLLTAEAAGLRPANGCRMGICHTCVCTKVSGVVRDKLTGAIDASPETRIRICVSEPLGPVTLDI